MIGGSRRPATAFVWVLFVSSVASAQPAKPPDEPPPRFESTAQFGLLATTGNTSTQTITLGGEVVYRPTPWVHSGKISFAQNRDEDVLKARSIDGRVRTERELRPRLSAYGQYAYLRDTFSGIEGRHTIEGGLSYIALEHGPHRLRLDGGMGYEREIRTIDEDVGSAAVIGGASYRWHISETSEFLDELHVTLTIPETQEWKLDHEASLTAALTSMFSLRVSNIIRFANEPVPTFEATDTITVVALVMKFSRPAHLP